MGRVTSDGAAARLYYHRRSNRLNFGTLAVATVPPSFESDGIPGGPLPVATYLIDVMRINTNKNPPIEWFNLHAPMDDGSGYYAYADNWKGRLAQLANLQGWRRGAFGIHPGARSLGCVTISPQEWASVRNYIKGGTLMYQPNSGQQQTFCATWW